MKLAVCDDDPIEIQKIEALIKEQFSLKDADGYGTVSTYRSGRELLASIEGHQSYDILILDIVMPEIDGIELAAKIREKDEACKIIFLTSSAEFAVDSYKVKAYYYILKRNMQNELPTVLQRAIGDMATDIASNIIIKEKYKKTRVPLSSIEYVESRNHTVYFHLNNHESLASYSAINSYYDLLSSDSRFIKCHKSFIVNMSYVKSITGNAFILDSGTTVPISRNLFSAVKTEYFNYFLKME